MKYKILIALIAAAAIVLTGCGDKSSQSGGTKTQVTVSLVKSSLASQIVHLSLEVDIDSAVFYRDTTDVSNGAFSFTSFEVPAGEATFLVNGFSESGRVLYSGTSTVTILPSQPNYIPVVLTPAVPMVKLSPYFADVRTASVVTSKLELFNIAHFAAGTFRINFDASLMRFDSVRASGNAWGILRIGADLSEGFVEVSVARPEGANDIPPNAPSLIDLIFTTIGTGTAHLSVQAQQMTDAQGATIPEITNETLVLDQQELNITEVSGNGTISGKTIDAKTRQNLSGVMIVIYGVFQDTTRFADTTYTNEQGEYSFSSLLQTFYVLVANMEGYEELVHAELISESSEQVLLPMLPLLQANEYRVVVRWSYLPLDLDLHMFTTINNQLYHVYYNDSGSVAEAPFAQLDYDDRNGFGPENITVYQLQSTCKFGIFNLSKADFDQNPIPGQFVPEITASGAYVEVHKGDELLEEFNVPTEGNGYWWYVFDLQADGTIVPRNEITNTNPGSGVASAKMPLKAQQ